MVRSSHGMSLLLPWGYRHRQRSGTKGTMSRGCSTALLWHLGEP